VRDIVLADTKPMVPLAIPRARGRETQLAVKEVIVGDRRYVVCFNEEQARRDAAARAAILDSLAGKLGAGDKALVGNAGYRRFLATPEDGHFAIDPARIEADARLTQGVHFVPDGLSVLRTNTTLPMLSVALAYRELWRVEQIFRTAKAILDTRPIFHQRDATIAGHLFCSFLALVLRKALDECLEAAGVVAEWADIVRDLDRLEEVTIDQRDKRFVLRLQAQGCAGAVCKAVGIALPPLVRQLPATRPPPNAKPAPKSRRGRPRRGATRPEFF
jgi:hypothetical protein